MYSNNFYNKRLKKNARNLRNRMTKAEACLWKYALRAGTMRGYTFNRQRPILNYIVDFMCKELKLVIEVDGISHFDNEVVKKDYRKQHDLEIAGFVVIRFRDEEVLRNMPAVRETILQAIVEIEEKR